MQMRVWIWSEDSRMAHRCLTCSCLRKMWSSWHLLKSLPRFSKLTRLSSRKKTIEELWRRPQTRDISIRVESSAAVSHWVVTRQRMFSYSYSRWTRTSIEFTWSWTSPMSSKKHWRRISQRLRLTHPRHPRSHLTRWWQDGLMSKSTRLARITPSSLS